MSNNSSSPSQMATILVNRSARALMRAQLRQHLQESRTGLRREREVSAVAAAVRTPRWRSARKVPPSGPPDHATADLALDGRQESLAAQHPAVPTEAGAAPEPDASPEAAVDISQAAGSIFAGLMGDLARRQEDEANLGTADESLHGPNVGIAAPSLSEVSAAAPATVSDPLPKVVQVCENHTPVITTTALGPGMLARLRLLGYGQFADLAAADPVALRHGLGDISRLLNVEGWIAEAKRIA